MTTTADSTRNVWAPQMQDPQRGWTRLLVLAVAASAAADVGMMTLAGTVIPPVAMGVVLSLVGLALLRRWPRKAKVMLAVVSGLIVVSSAPFAVPHLAHPGSAVDFIHSSIHLGGRLVAVAAAIGALRAASPVAARRFGVLAAGLLGATVLLGAIATSLTSRVAAAPGDVTVAVRDFAFPPEVRAPTNATVFVDNDDLNRHTFTVADTDLSHELPAGAGVRFRLDLPPGTYRLFCSVPGHESMQAELIVA